jgi:indole-3-glycerol phosphate synthase
MTGLRRLSQAISEGDGISVIVEVADADAARAAEHQGAEAILIYSGYEERLPSIREATSLPVVFFWDGERSEKLEGADACIVEARGDRDREWLEHVHLNLGDTFELALRVDDEEHLESAFEQFDPEIVVLAPAQQAEAEDAVGRVLDLLPDVPAGKLAIAEVPTATREEIVALERAGIDGVIVGARSIADLVGDAPPEV